MKEYELEIKVSSQFRMGDLLRDFSQWLEDNDVESKISLDRLKALMDIMLLNRFEKDYKSGLCMPDKDVSISYKIPDSFYLHYFHHLLEED